MSQDRPPTNFRKRRRKEDKIQLGLALFVLVIIGTGLIGFIWGARSAFLGGICLAGGGGVIIGIWLLLSLLEKWVARD